MDCQNKKIIQLQKKHVKEDNDVLILQLVNSNMCLKKNDQKLTTDSIDKKIWKHILFNIYIYLDWNKKNLIL